MQIKIKRLELPKTLVDDKIFMEHTVAQSTMGLLLSMDKSLYNKNLLIRSSIDHHQTMVSAK